jgi:hypothetical protein
MHLFMLGLPLFTLFRSADPIFMVDLQMAPTVELSVDGMSYHGFAQVLYDVLDELGVPTE